MITAKSHFLKYWPIKRKSFPTGPNKCGITSLKINTKRQELVTQTSMPSKARESET